MTNLNYRIGQWNRSNFKDPSVILSHFTSFKKSLFVSRNSYNLVSGDIIYVLNSNFLNLYLIWSVSPRILIRKIDYRWIVNNYLSSNWLSWESYDFPFRASVHLTDTDIRGYGLLIKNFSLGHIFFSIYHQSYVS